MAASAPVPVNPFPYRLPAGTVTVADANYSSSDRVQAFHFADGPALRAVYVAVLFLSILDVTIVNMAIPTIGRDFHTSAASVDGVVVGFLVSLAVLIPASGWIGSKRTLLAATAMFTGASALCGPPHSLGQLVVVRVVHGGAAELDGPGGDVGGGADGQPAPAR